MSSSDFVNCYACNANDTIDSDAWVWADMHGNVWADPDDKEPWCVGCLPAQQDDAPTKGGTMKANRDCAFCMDPREDGPIHPYINLAVYFDGPTDTSIDALIAAASDLVGRLKALKTGGGSICSRDGRHISYVPGDYDPWPLVPVDQGE